MNSAISAFRERAKRRPLLLVVDDEPAILDSLEMALPLYGIDLKLAPHWVTAVSLYKRHHEQIEAALIDVQMPDFDGPALLEKLKEVNVKLQACFMTGNSGYHTNESLQRLSGWPVIEKPFLNLNFVALSLWKMIDESSE